MIAPEATVRGLRADDAKRPVQDYFASFRWEPSPMDPSTLSASEYLAMLGADDIVDSATLPVPPPRDRV